MSPLTVSPSPQGEKQEGTGDSGRTAASLSDTEHGGPAAEATIEVRGTSSPTPVSSEPILSAQQLTPEAIQEVVKPRTCGPEELTSAAGSGHGEEQDGTHRGNQADASSNPPQVGSLGSASAAVDSSVIATPTEAGVLTNAPADASTGVTSEPANGMDHFQRLRRRMLISTLLASSAAVPLCWLLFDLPAALSLLVGSVAGLLYLVLLARSVARLGGDRRSVSKIQLLVPVVLVLASARIPQLQLVPALVGFLLYKPALLVQALLDR